jgi:hypothetical protein
MNLFSLGQDTVEDGQCVTFSNITENTNKVVNTWMQKFKSLSHKCEMTNLLIVQPPISGPTKRSPKLLFLYERRFILYAPKYDGRWDLETKHKLQMCYSSRSVAGSIYKVGS